MHLIKAKKSFTLMELLAVVIIISVTAVIAIPQYQKVVEGHIASEGISALTAIRSAQLRQKIDKGAYASVLANLDIVPGASANFNTPNVSNAVGQVGWITRPGKYSLYIGETGVLTCCAGSGSYCDQFGILTCGCSVGDPNPPSCVP